MLACAHILWNMKGLRCHWDDSLNTLPVITVPVDCHLLPHAGWLFSINLIFRSAPYLNNIPCKLLFVLPFKLSVFIIKLPVRKDSNNLA